MNLRIKELIKQADEKFSCEYNGDYTVFNKEKFGELIVRECAKRSAELGNPEVGQGLMKHFGVEL